MQNILQQYKSKLSELTYANSQLDNELQNYKDLEDDNLKLNETNEELRRINEELKNGFEINERELAEKEKY